MRALLGNNPLEMGFQIDTARTNKSSFFYHFTIWAVTFTADSIAGVAINYWSNDIFNQSIVNAIGIHWLGDRFAGSLNAEELHLVGRSKCVRSWLSKCLDGFCGSHTGWCTATGPQKRLRWKVTAPFWAFEVLSLDHDLLLSVLSKMTSIMILRFGS